MPVHAVTAVGKGKEARRGSFRIVAHILDAAREHMTEVEIETALGRARVLMLEALELLDTAEQWEAGARLDLAIHWVESTLESRERGASNA